MPASVVWFRRDLRLGDHPALVAAVAQGGPIVPVFVSDPRLRRPSGPARLAFLTGCLSSLAQSTGGHLVFRTGDPAATVAALAIEVGAENVYMTADFGPYGHRRDGRVEQALEASGRHLVAVGSPYAVEPGTTLKSNGQPYGVFTPFYRAWRDRGWAHQAPAPAAIAWAEGVRSEGIPEGPTVDARLPPPGEAAASDRLEAFLASDAESYARLRDNPAADATTRLSPYLKYGCVHPRQILDRLGPSPAHEKLRREVAWREFYADVVWHRPESARRSLRPAMAGLRLDAGPAADARFAAWTSGRTGYPLVDAGMRQLRAEAWMHNRVRMVTASFLVKDLHIDWTRGAHWFLQHLVDGDLASNNHGWQWVAGTGTDPAPYFRIFNPTTQANEYDPQGRYIRGWVPELAGLAPPQVFEPWKVPGGPPNNYPAPIVDHGHERIEALARYGELRR